ncbi:SDR family NAD(P)-dependent oxidoreductase [Arthrobacter sp. I2-34]|uniref:SDR family NAD(P)-dependent oxidoreductase n=1 Tax=Arthrobacter hankyongi TaxID=2904801 RepID=A0ABS9LBT7_9MICC|nr:SDR family NAD(P)-dependent oxidoreductase [Arthrobacter hankyongi]MCG2624137.1 SDR family NAD(P)-dependent oxidoreductase [Arthrobacter hankyongi]
MNGPLDGLRVVVAGAASASGQAVAGALTAAGAAVVAVGSNPERLAKAFAPAGTADPAVATYTCDLADPGAVSALATAVRAEQGPVDGLIHLVGGWRGGGGLGGQSDQDWDFLHHGIMTTLRNTTRTFYPDLAASPRGRAAIVSATAVDSPTAGGANYAAVKAAAETWMRAVAQGFRQDQTKAGEAAEPGALHSAAVVFVVKALVDDGMRAAEPERSFAGFTDVETLAAAVRDLFTTDAAELNGSRRKLA